MNCTNHPKVEAEKVCVGCGNPFCDDCLTKIKNKNYCKNCIAEKFEEKEDSKEVVKPEIVVTQTNNNSNDGFLDKVCKACCIIIALLIILYIIAVIFFGIGLSAGMR